MYLISHKKKYRGVAGKTILVVQTILEPIKIASHYLEP